MTDIKKLTRQQLFESIKRQAMDLGLQKEIAPTQLPQDPNANQVAVTNVAPQQPNVTDVIDEPQHQVEDEIGTIYIVKQPIEGCELAHMIDECSVLDLNHKLSTGELTKEGISAICKSSASANRKAAKAIQDFHKNLNKSRKEELKELKNKKEYFETRINATNKRYGGEEMLDEVQKDKLSRIRKGLSQVDRKIIKLENHLRALKENPDKIEDK